MAGLASNGTEAVQQALKIGPDIILMDINLGQGIDGVEAAGLIRRDVDIPVVYLTAHSDDATLQRAKVSEPYGYVLKPYEDSDLQTAIEIGLYRHLMEARLRENEAWLTATLSSIGDGVIACDDQGQIRFMNSLAEQLTGWTQKEAIGRTLRDVFRTVSAEDHKPLANPALEALRKGEDTLLSSSVILIDRNESQCHIENEASPIRDSQGRITGSVLVFRDVTERRRMEENLRQAQKMEAIGRLAGGIAHDFNNIMTVIIGFSDYLLNEETFPPDKKDVVQKIHDAGTRAAALTQQIMAFSRKQILAPEVLCLNSIIRELEPMIRRLIGANIELITQLDLKVGSIRADRSQMEQVIVNLAANARDAMPSGGRLTISTVNHEDVLTDTDQSDCVARMTIEDNGTGIPDDILEHAFNDPAIVRIIGVIINERDSN